ncbi:MAG: protein kinase [Deltaproteobacteria bacterium]|nr:protein kinase [Deltaproteobacteria bacterium]
MPPGTNFGAYTLVRRIAAGGMAEIYLAATSGVDGVERHLALKVIHPEYADDRSFVQMLIDEAKLSIALNHPNIVQTFDLEQLDKSYFISMEFVDGCDYFQLLKKLSTRGEKVPIDIALFVAREALSGLDYAHTKVDPTGTPLKIIHRDISPQNILVSREGRVKLVDFGIAKATNLSSKTRAGVIKGKLVYMSPEQSWGDPVDQRTDIYSAGMVLYEALVGRSAYLETNPVKLLQLVRKAALPPPSAFRPEIDAALDALVMRSLAPRPADRFQTAREAVAAVTGLLQQRQADERGPRTLGALVQSTLDHDDEADEIELEVGDLIRAEPMDRGDFAVQQHSVIFSAEEMLGASNDALSAMESSTRESNVPAGIQDPNLGVSAKLILIEEDGTKSFDIDEQFIIGRGGDLRLSDGRVSRRHARIVAHEGAYLLEDLKSSNGTFLNNKKVGQVERLTGGDHIRIGPFKMQFTLETPRSDDAMRATTPAPSRDASPSPRPPQVAPRPQVAPPPPRQPQIAPLPPRTESPPPPPRPRIAPPPPQPLSSHAQPRASDESSLRAARHRPGRVEEAPPSPSPSPAPGMLTGPTASPRGGGATDEMTAKQRALASLKLTLGDETLTLLIEGRVTLGQHLTVGGMAIDGPSSLVLRRNESYWIEPVPRHRTAILNGAPITRPTQLKEGDTVAVGTLQLEFNVGD